VVNNESFSSHSHSTFNIMRPEADLYLRPSR
jgi:hypothetical protein